MRGTVSFYLNGELHQVSGKSCFLTLSDYLRRMKCLTGTKVVCAEGDCGACSVLKSSPVFLKDNKPTFEMMNSCVALVAQMDGCVLLSVEALGDLEQLHPIQKAMYDNHASQCGFCTPGFVMALADLFESHKKVKDEQEVKNHLTGNLCRCTGYLSILEAAKSVDASLFEQLRKKFITTAAVKTLREHCKKSLMIETPEALYLAPKNKNELSGILRQHKKIVILAAGTDLGVQRNKHGRRPPILLSLHLLEELYKVKLSPKTVVVPARVTFSQLRKTLLKNAPEIANFLDLFASPQIKNVATLVGNVANGSPIADSPPFLFALEAKVHVFSFKTRKTTKIPISEFYLDYRKLKLKPGELIWAVEFELPKKGERLFLKKVSQRKDLDISTVNVGFWAARGKGVRPVRLALGGVGPTPMRLKKTEKEFLKGADLKKLLSTAQSEITPISDVRSSSAYRRVVVNNYLKEFLSEVFS